MHVEYAFLADAASAGPDGKFNVLGGGVEQILARDFPVVVPTLALVGKLALLPSECDVEHHLQMEIRDRDGELIAPRLSAAFSAQRSAPAPIRQISVQFTLAVHGLQFRQPGAHTFQTDVDGQHLSTVTVHVEEVGPAACAAAGP